ncbi:MAG: hypothetical protein ABR530_07300 [Pyrinomonadaceae bacterium]
MRNKLNGLLLIFLVFPIAASTAFSSPEPSVRYTIRINAADLTGIDVEMRVDNAPKVTRIAMAAHPEYDDRYFRFIENVTASSKGRSLTVAREDDPLWRIDGVDNQVTVKYRLRFSPVAEGNSHDAWKPFLTPTGGMVGDLHCLMYVLGGEARPSSLTLDIPSEWKAVSGLEPTSDSKTFRGSTELILDSPVMVGQLSEWKFTAGGVPHSMVIWAPPDAKAIDPQPLLEGIEKLVDQSIKAFGRPPYPRYVFLFQQGGQAALEHLTSVNIGLSLELSDLFEQVAHEYIHVWNLMDVRPRERVGLRYRFAEPTGVLWWNEGATIMFADLLLRRAGLPRDSRSQIQRLESIIARYLASPGYSTLSGELISRGDSHPILLGDYSTSTHLHGEVLSTMLDLKIPEVTNGRKDVTDVMRVLSEKFDFKRGITNADIEKALADVCGCEVKSFFRDHIYGAKPVDFDRYLGIIGLRTEVTWATAVGSDGKPAVDLRVGPLSFDGQLVLRITNPRAAWGEAGLHTGDKLVSVDGRPVTTWAQFRQWLRTLKVADVGRLAVKSNGVAKTVDVTIDPFAVPTVRIVELKDATAKQVRLRHAWISAQ